MKRTTIVAAAAAAVTLGLTGTALAGTGDDRRPSSVTVSPSPSATDDDGGLRGDGSVDDNGDDGGLRGDGSVDDDGPSASPSPSATSSRPSGPATGGISSAQAGRVAVAAAGGGAIVRIEAETEHGRAVWDVRVQNGPVRHDIDVDRVTGQVTRHKADVKSSGSTKSAGGGSGSSSGSSSGSGSSGSGRSGGSDDRGGDDGGRGRHGGDDDGGLRGDGTVDDD